MTGASGFVGAPLCRHLVAAGAEVHAVGRAPARPPRVPATARWWRADLTDEHAVRTLVGAVRPRVVLHLASAVTGARDLDQVVPTFRAGLAATVHVLVAAAEHAVPRVVMTGSMEEPADLAEPPASPYAAAKLGARAYGQLVAAHHGVDVVHLRTFMVYGPDQPDERKLVPATVLSLLRGEPPRISSGVRRVDWVYVDDVVEALVAAASAPLPPGFTTVDVGTGRTATVRDVVDRLVALVDPSLAPEVGAVADRPHEVEPVADPAPAARLLGWSPRVDLDEGLRHTVDWYRGR